MVNFHRVKRNFLFFIIGFLLVSVVEFAYAETAPYSYYYQDYGGNGAGHCAEIKVYFTSDAALACVNQYATYKPGQWGFTATNYSTLPSRTYGVWRDSDSSYAYNGTIGASTYCPTGWNDQAGACYRPDCVAPQVRNATTGICENPNPCTVKKGNFLSQGKYDWGISPNNAVLSVCDGTCNATFSGSQAIARYLQNGVYHYVADGNYAFDGSQCSNSNSLPAMGSVPPDSCPAGQILGTLNGKNMCVLAGVVQNPNPAPVPATPGVSSSTITNSDGSTTTKTTATAADGGTTVTTTNTPAGGGQPTAITKEVPPPSSDPLDDYCKKNPSVKICKSTSDSSFSGGCGSFVCDGDAIQCAIAREQHQRNCALFDTATPLSTLGNELAAGNDEGVNANPAKTSNRSIINLPTQLNTSKSIAATCMPDLTVQVMSSSIVIPFSNICQYLEIMGRIVVAFSLIAAGRIVSGGVA